ncbi:MAG: TonB-dependent receptor [Acidobacteria bacterium]|nr:TonB-dependent receptor [Acidobacteriota bacterium]
MRTFAKLAPALLWVVLLPSIASAQASLTGVVRDTSGGVLPGVTVEAASPVLIEKVRTAVTDGNGRYQLVDLRPGAYTVTFGLAGFNTVRRDGITLAGTAASTVDVELRVGALEETITVTGEAPVVDVQSTSRQAVLSADVIDALPTARNYVTLARLIPGTSGGGNDVGGSVTQGTGGSVTIHGSRTQDQRVTLNGINTMTLQAGGNIGGQIPDVGSASEITIDHTAVSAELPTGGVRINFIPRDGGNRFTNATFFTFSNGSLQGDNFTQRLKDAGLGTPDEIWKNWDLNESVGGPFRRDKVWFWFSTRYNGADRYAPIFANKNAWNPNEWLYEPDTSRRGFNKGRVFQNSLRVTWQASERNKIAGTYKVDRWCNCPNNVSATRAPETATDFRFPRLRQEHLEWTSPVTNRLLLEAVGMHLFERWGNMHPPRSNGTENDPAVVAIAPQMISVVEQSTGLRYRINNTYNNTLVPNFAYRAAMAYVTGTHNIKVGFNRVHGFQDTTTYALNPVSYRFNNGVPNQITLESTPRPLRNHQDNDLGFYAQDRWTLNRYTVNLALRYDYFGTSFPEQRIGPGPLVPTRNLTFPAQDNLAWHDITYRTGLTYDLRGDGRTAFKATFNKYLRGQTLNTLGSQPNPVNTLVNSTTRSWNDRGGQGINGDFVPQCDLTNPNANGECGAMANRNFGTPVPGAQYDPDLLTGWGHRERNWEFSVGVQHEILPRISVDVGFFRRIWGNFQVTDDLALSAADFDTFSMVVPSDQRLPNGGGYRLEGLRNLKPTAFGRPSQNFNTLSSKYGKQIEHWNGYDITVNGRLQNGLTFQFGTSTGRTSENDCEIVAKLPELNFTGNQRPLQFCDRQTPWLTSVKGYAVYTVPRIDVQLSGTFRSTKESSINANFTATNAYLAANSTLGRPLSGGAANMSVALLQPSTMYLDRRNELDLRFGKVLRFGRSRSVVSLDLYNTLNNDAVLSVNENFASWMRPQQILNARMAKISVQFDW